jgi:hypothetical protein
MQMLSVVVYGRNDAHGFNLHKRVALSLNSLAEHLNNVDDEIVFVDWNSPSGIGSLPEMISDTLTLKCRKLLKIISVDEKIHNSLVPTGHKRPVIESVARNVGIRRTNSQNNWILCTNTDILIQSKSGLTLSELTKDLTPGFYQAFRYEIPEYIWAGFNRLEPQQALDSFDQFYGSYDATLSRIFFGNETPDAPGDFQLADRNAWFQCGVFPEGMVLGSHVDSILALKMATIRPVQILRNQLQVFHCNHLRQLTHLHNPKIEKDVFDPAYAKSNLKSDIQASWGLKGSELPCFTLDSSNDVKKIALAESFVKSWSSLGVKVNMPVSVDKPIESTSERLLLWLMESLTISQEFKSFYVGLDEILRGLISTLPILNGESVSTIEELNKLLLSTSTDIQLIMDFRFKHEIKGLYEFLIRFDQVIQEKYSKNNTKIYVIAIGLQYPRDLYFADKFRSRTGDSYTQIQLGSFQKKAKRFSFIRKVLG